MKKSDKRNNHKSSKPHMIYVSSNNDRHPVIKTFTPLHYNDIVRCSTSLWPRPCCGLSLSPLSEATQNLPTSVPGCFQRTTDGRSSATCRFPFCPPALSTVSGNFVKGEHSQNTTCVEKMVYSAIETTCFGLYWPSSSFYSIVLYTI